MIEKLKADRAAIEAHNASVAAGHADNPALAAARAFAHQQLSESIADLEAGQPDRHADVRAAGAAAMAKASDRPIHPVNARLLAGGH